MGKVRVTMLMLAGLSLLVLGGFLAYVLPQHRVVHVDGFEVKRVDGRAVAVTPQQQPAPVSGSDVYFIHASNPARTDVHVFRNEDTGFGFPWYLKFDAAELQGQAQLLARDDNQLVLLTYYGWRIPMLKLFPNVVDVEAWDSTTEPWPVFNIVFLGMFAVLAGVIVWKFRSWRQRWRDRKNAV